jgi:hypothetical protein
MSAQEELALLYPGGTPPVAARVPSALPEHLIGLSDEWAAWRHVGLRGAGFPAADVLTLAAPECAAAADRLIDAELECEDTQQEALRVLRGELDALRQERHEDEAGRRGLLNKALRDVKKGRMPKTQGLSERVRRALERLPEVGAHIAPARAAFCEAFASASVRLSKKLVAVASSERFREAVLWQNRQALHGSIDGLLRMDEDFTNRCVERRKREAVVASYLQRYCVKNDTIGFFGPVGWARFAESGGWVVSRPGPALVDARNVYFECWGMDALAETLARDKALRPWFAPRLLPFFHLDGATLYAHYQRPTRLSPQEAAVLQACDGERTAREIAGRLLRDAALGLSLEAEVYQLLELFEGMGLIAWTLEVPVTLHPDRVLRRALEKIEDEELRTRALGMLEELERARAAVAAAAGDCERLDGAMARLEETFTKLTGSAPTRPGGEGKAYSSRTLVYEDCRRDVEVELGGELAKSLGEPLTLLLTSARWLTCELAESFRKTFEQVHARLARKSGSHVIDLAGFWFNILPSLFDRELDHAGPVLRRFQQRWADVLALDPRGEQRRVQYTCDELRPRVLAAFEAAAPGWAMARYHSPDVLVAAAGPEAARRGDCFFVLGEMHFASHTMRNTLFAAQHPAPEDFQRAYERDFPETRIMPASPKSWPELTARTLSLMLNPWDWVLLGGRDTFGAPKSQALNIGSLVVEQTADGLLVRTRDGRLSFDAVGTFASEMLSSVLVNCFKIFGPRRHTPRLTIDNLVVNRESWSFEPEEMEFAFQKSEAERFLAARRWMRERELPRFVFYKSPVERKPYYVDFESPMYVDMFARAVRCSAEGDAGHQPIDLSEMLPGPGQHWLRDAEGNAYTGELRIIALDLTSRRANV